MDNHKSDRRKRIAQFVDNIGQTRDTLSRNLTIHAMNDIIPLIFSRDQADVDSGFDSLHVLMTKLEMFRG